MPRPNWELYICYPDREEIYDGDFDLNTLLFCKFNIELPILITGRHIYLNVSPYDFKLKVKKMYELVLKFPYKVDT